MKSFIPYVVLIVVAPLFVVSGTQGDDSSSNANVTFECQCETNNTDASQSTYNCDCQTFLVEGDKKRHCFYDCSGDGNYTCKVNKTCEEIVICSSCHENATCKNKTPDTYGCFCKEGFFGDGKNCQKCSVTPKMSCPCPSKTYCCSLNTTCPADCKNCKEEPCSNSAHGVGNMTCWCSETCGRLHGNFSAWSPWSSCSRLCGPGTQSRTRNCTNPAPFKGGRECNGTFNETQPCNFTACPTIKFSEEKYFSKEKDGNVTVVVELVFGEVVREFKISFTTLNGTAKEGQDYSLPDEVTFTAADPGPKNIAIGLKQDSLIEGEEYFWINFTANDSDVTTKGEARVVIGDSDVASVKFENRTYLINESCRTVIVRVVLTGNISIPVNASLTTNDITAMRDIDYVGLVNKKIKFKPNETMAKEISITIINEKLVENTEAFSVTLTSESFSMLVVKDPKTTVVRIDNDDVAVVTFERSHYSAFEDSGIVTVGINIRGEIADNVTIRVEIMVSGTDVDKHLNISGLTEIAEFKRNGSHHFNISIINDNVSETNRTFSLKLRSMSLCNAIASSPLETNITLVDNDVDGDFTSWSGWSNCSRTCGVGNQERTRSCTSPPQRGEGKNCNGSERESRPCNITLTCPGSYNCSSMWSNWTACNVSCGTGYQSRNRTWYNVVKNVQTCNGTTIEERQCNMTACPTTGTLATTTTPSRTASPARTATPATTTTIATSTSIAATTVISYWSDWSPCSATCDQGFRTRSCTNKTGYGCNGTTVESCDDLEPCPVDGYYLIWSGWTKCTQTCGSGKQSRSRTCKEPLHGGKNCSGEALSEVTACTNPTLCPDELGYSPWSEWSECSVTCLSGIKTRYRTCENNKDSINCTGPSRGNETCHAGECPVHGNWGDWSSWLSCPGTCGSSFINRTRKCDKPIPQHGGANCTGHAYEEEECNHAKRCTGESEFTPWSDWSLCSKTCGGGVNERTRKCYHKTPHDECKKEDFQKKSCYHGPCPVNGGWSLWGDWSRCSSFCGSGVRKRRRTCTSPTPSSDGLPCYGENYDEIMCVMPEDCKEDTAYKSWESWSDCNATSCGYGKRTRKRECKLVPKYPPEGELICTSPSQDYQYISCYNDSCPLDGNFTEWSFWSRCNATCGDGVRSRTRHCSHPPSSKGGADCIGKRLDVQDCKTNKTCPDDSFYHSWSSWGNCSNNCEGKTNRIRNCLNATNVNCSGLQNISKDCNTEICNVDGGWSEWTLWSFCDLSQCGYQEEKRHRTCNNPYPKAAGEKCIGEEKETTFCREEDPKPCKETHVAGWTDWSWWKPCSKSCDSGVRSRKRKCTNPPPSPGGLNCTGNFSQIESCNAHFCPVDGKFTEWSAWTNCTKRCGNGTRTRYRNCTNPPPQHGGSDCVPANFTNELGYCNVFPCPIHGGLTPWSPYSFCSKPCNTGYRERTRSCTNPPPQFNGRNCTCNKTDKSYGLDNCTVKYEDIRTCNVLACPPVRVLAQITYNDSSRSFEGPNEDGFKKHLDSYISSAYTLLKPTVGISLCSSENHIFTCTLSLRYNFSDGDQLPRLRDILDPQEPNSSVSLLWMNSSVVFSNDMNITTRVLSSTSIAVGWSIDVSRSENLTGITVFYKTLDDNAAFQSVSVPASVQDSMNLTGLKKFTWYRITVSPTTANGTGVPSRFSIKKTLEDVPSKAPAVNVTSPNSTSLYVTWQPIDTEYLHGIHRGYCVYIDNKTEIINDTGGNYELQKTIVDLRPFTQLHIQVALRTTPGCGVKSSKMSVYTLEDKPDSHPQNVRARNQSSTSLFVEWEEVDNYSRNGIILGYNITYTVEESTSKSKIVRPATTLQTVISGLSIWTFYNVSVAAYTKVGLGPFSPLVKVRTEEGVPPVAPKIVVAKNASSGSIYIKWDKISETEYGILLGYELTYIALDYRLAKRKVKRFLVTDNTLEYKITDLFYYWQYKITVGGYTRPGVGKVATKTVRTDEHIPGRSPEDVHGVAETSTSIYIHWKKVASNFVHGILLGYNLTVRKTRDLSHLVGYRDKLVQENEVPAYLKGLGKYTEYTIWVRAVNSKGHGKLNSPEGYRIRTKEDAPDVPPSSIVVKNMTSISTLELEWKRIPEEQANGIIRGYYVEYTAIRLNGQDVEPGKREKQTLRVRGNRYATTLENLIPGSKYEIVMFGYTIKNGTKSKKYIGETCRCPEYLKVNWWNIPPYTNGDELKPGGIFSLPVEMMLEMCGVCSNGHGKTKACYRPGCDQHTSRRRREVETLEKDSFQEVLNNINNDVDISFPIQGNKYMTHYGGVFPYISVVETPGSVYFTVKNIPSTAHVLLNASVYSIPLLLLVFILSLLAGIVIWVLERSSNPTSFPLSFTKGLKEGFWWAFISASTVGYGDRRPVTIPGKLFAITWILVGYIIITLLTSLMVTSITEVLVKQRKTIYGAKVAAIQNSTEYGKAIRQNGKVQAYKNVDEVIKALEDKSVEGAILDMYAAAMRKDLFENGDIELTRQVEYPAGYGIVLSGRMKDSAPMIKEYLKLRTNELLEFVQNNTDVVTQKGLNQVQEAAQKKSGLFDSSYKAYQMSLLVITSLLAACICAGLCWQHKYHAKAVKVRNKLRKSTHGYAIYEYLREDAKASQEKHFRALITRLRKVRQHHMEELKLLAKYYKRSGRVSPASPASPNFASTASSTVSLARIRKMTSTVRPSLNSRHNIALQVLDVEEEHASQSCKDSQV